MHIHLGMVAPMGWREEETKVEIKPRGRPRTEGTITTVELLAWTQEQGGQAKAARILDIPRRTLRNYLAGRAMPPQTAARITHKVFGPAEGVTKAGPENPSKVSIGFSGPAPESGTRLSPLVRRLRREAETASPEPSAHDAEDAAYAYRERFAIAVEGGASEAQAHRIALREAHADYKWLAWAGAFAFEPMQGRPEVAA